jgi:pimeloyl-ACP methyl ester carboxylesterase
MSAMPELEGVSHRWVETSRLRMHVAESGDLANPPLVLLHGWPQHWYLWRHQIPRFAERYHVVCPDLRGLGWSDAPRRGYEKESLADDVRALLDALEIESAYVMGHDWGAHTGFLLCLRNPDRVRRYVALNDIHPWIRLSPRDALNGWRLWYQWVLATPGAGAWLVRNKPGFVRRLIRAWSSRDVWSEDELDIYAEVLREPARAQASAQYYRTFLVRELLPTLAGQYKDERLSTPTLLLFGEDDGVIRPYQLRGFESHADDMQLELVPGVGHFTPEEAPDLVFERALSHFEA